MVWLLRNGFLAWAGPASAASSARPSTSTAVFRMMSSLPRRADIAGSAKFRRLPERRPRSEVGSQAGRHSLSTVEGPKSKQVILLGLDVWDRVVDGGEEFDIRAIGAGTRLPEVRGQPPDRAWRTISG